MWWRFPTHQEWWRKNIKRCNKKPKWKIIRNCLTFGCSAWKWVAPLLLIQFKVQYSARTYVDRILCLKIVHTTCLLSHTLQHSAFDIFPLFTLISREILIRLYEGCDCLGSYDFISQFRACSRCRTTPSNVCRLWPLPTQVKANRFVSANKMFQIPLNELNRFIETFISELSQRLLLVTPNASFRFFLCCASYSFVNIRHFEIEK